MNIVIVSTGKRIQLLEQTVQSILDNSSKLHSHRLVLVIDGYENVPDLNNELRDKSVGTFINNRVRQGASASRNIGASSIPKYRRQEYVCFFDDDVYCCPGWDAFNFKPDAVWSGHAHPFNHPYRLVDSSVPADQTSVISTVHMIIPWAIWDEVGWFVEPGGPGGSEDVDWCARARGLGYTLGITQPQSVLHTGIGSTSGSKLIGWDQVMKNNSRLEKLHGIEGKVIYA